MTTVSKTILLYNIVSKHTIYKMYQRHSFGAPPPIFTPPPAPYSPKHRAYARPTVPHQDVVPPQVAALHQDVVPQQDGGFPSQLSLRTTQSRAPQPVPAIAFSDNITQSVADLFNKQVKIYVTPTSSGRYSPRRRSSSQLQRTRGSGLQSLT